MKVRESFVSNSSSSSFILGVKGKLTKKKIMEIFKVPKDSPLFYLAEGVAEVIIAKSEKMNAQEYMEDLGYEDGKWDDDDLPEIFSKCAEKGLTTYKGFAEDQDGDLEKILCDMDLNYEDDDFIIEKEGGY